MSEQNIKELSEMDVLTSFKNKHLNNYLSAKIDVDIYEGIVSQNPQQTVQYERQEGPNGQIMQVPISAEKMLKSRREVMENQLRILKAIEKMKEEYAK